jgi:hypothetical protein
LAALQGQHVLVQDHPKDPIHANKVIFFRNKSNRQHRPMPCEAAWWGILERQYSAWLEPGIASMILL